MDEGEHPDALVSRPRDGARLLLPLVGVPQAHRIDAARMGAHRISAAGEACDGLQRDQLRAGAACCGRALATRPALHRGLPLILADRWRRWRPAAALSPVQQLDGVGRVGSLARRRRYEEYAVAPRF